MSCLPHRYFQTSLHPHPVRRNYTKKMWRCDTCKTAGNGAQRRYAPAPEMGSDFDMCEDCLAPFKDHQANADLEHFPEATHAPIHKQHAQYNHREPRKRAVIIGCSYTGTSAELEGCINDTICMKKLLIEVYAFSESEIRVLNEQRGNKKPTKQAIIDSFRWLVADCMAGDALMIHYSGHGVQRKDKSGDEISGFDDAIVPLDFKKKGLILDDEINEILVRPIPTGVRLHAIMDCCHSGTMLDLDWVWNYPPSKGGPNEHDWFHDTKPNCTAIQGANGGQVICISGCDDNQESADTNAFGDHRSKQGAMTYSLIHAIELNLAKSYYELVTSMRALLQRTLMPEEGVYPGEEERDVELKRLHEYVQRRLSNPVRTPVQVPQLSSSGPPIGLHEPFTFQHRDAHHMDHPHCHQTKSRGLAGYMDAHDAKLKKMANNEWRAFSSSI